MYALPMWAIGLIYVLGPVVVGVGGMLLVRPTIHRLIHQQEGLNEMVSLNIASFSLFYAIMLGLAVVGVYTQYSSTTDVVEREASTLAALYSDTRALPEANRAVLLADLRAYAKETIDKDWPAQRAGHVPTDGTQKILAYQQHMSEVKPDDRAAQISYAGAFGQYEKLVELRATRLARVTSQTPALLWWIIGVGGVLTVGIIWMLDMEVYIHCILTAVLCLFLGIVFFFIADMDKPFRGDAFVGPDAYELVYRDLMQSPDTGPPANPGFQAPAAPHGTKLLRPTI
jgi:Protein of unknown function (DUF4239)